MKLMGGFNQKKQTYISVMRILTANPNDEALYLITETAKRKKKF